MTFFECYIAISKIKQSPIPVLTYETSADTSSASVGAGLFHISIGVSKIKQQHAIDYVEFIKK